MSRAPPSLMARGRSSDDDSDVVVQLGLKAEQWPWTGTPGNVFSPCHSSSHHRGRTRLLVVDTARIGCWCGPIVGRALSPNYAHPARVNSFSTARRPWSTDVP
jgi:hypothetical protein